MLERFERPLKIICAAMAVLVVLQLVNLVWRGDPLAHLKIPALPTLPETTNEPSKIVQKESGSAPGKKSVTNDSKGTNIVTVTNAVNTSYATTITNALTATNTAIGTNPVTATNRVARATGGRRNSEAQTNLPGYPRA